MSISVSEKHKRELEQLIKETELLKRENRRIREESKQKGKYDFLNGHQANWRLINSANYDLNYNESPA